MSEGREKSIPPCYDNLSLQEVSVTEDKPVPLQEWHGREERGLAADRA